MRGHDHAVIGHFDFKVDRLGKLKASSADFRATVCRIIRMVGINRPLCTAVNGGTGSELFKTVSFVRGRGYAENITGLIRGMTKIIHHFTPCNGRQLDNLFVGVHLHLQAVVVGLQVKNGFQGHRLVRHYKSNGGITFLVGSFRCRVE